MKKTTQSKESAAGYCKQHGFNLKQLSESTTVHVQTLNRWYSEKPELFQAVVKGKAAMIAVNLING